MSNKEDRDYQYQVLVSGVEFQKGDAHTIGMIFGNLDGRNFAIPRPGSEQTHDQWLQYMAAEYKTPLEQGAAIQLVSPEGVVLQASAIGTTVVQTEDASLGQPRADQYGVPRG